MRQSVRQRFDRCGRSWEGGAKVQIGAGREVAGLLTGLPGMRVLQLEGAEPLPDEELVRAELARRS